MTNFELFIHNTYLDILTERIPDGHPIGSIISGIGSIENLYIKYLLDISMLLRINRRRLNTIKRREEVL